MNFGLIGSIARSLLLARRKQTIVAAVGVTFSITMFIALLGFMAGLNDLLDGLMTNRSAHIRLFNEMEPARIQPIEQSPAYIHQYHFIRSVKPGNARQQVYNSGAIIQTLLKDDRVLGVSAKISTPVFFTNISADIAGIINGIEVQQESALFHFEEYMVEGHTNDIDKLSNTIILGKGLAEKLAVNVGDRVQVATVGGVLFQLKVAGFYQTGISEVDKTQSYASVATVQKLMGVPNTFITEIQIKLRDMAMAPGLAVEYGKLFEMNAVDIQSANAQLETGSFLRTLISYAVGIVLLVVAGFGIYNILNMMIYEKMDTIAILKATGFSGKDVQRVFLIIALTIGVFGGMAGLLTGLGLSVLIDQVPFTTASLPSVTTYPVNYNPVFYLIGALFSLFTTFFAGWFPARKASKIDPVQIIRGK
jgi:lipoprotein-releasing system permease protein